MIDVRGNPDRRYYLVTGEGRIREIDFGGIVLSSRSDGTALWAVVSNGKPRDANGDITTDRVHIVRWASGKMKTVFLPGNQEKCVFQTVLRTKHNSASGVAVGIQKFGSSTSDATYEVYAVGENKKGTLTLSLPITISGVSSVFSRLCPVSNSKILVPTADGTVVARQLPPIAQ